VKARILVADDEKGMRDFLSILLRKEGYEVTVAANGEAALESVSQQEFDLLVTDIRMPGLSGIDLLREVRAISPGLLVVLITAYASTQTAIAALKLGAHDYITKPFDVEEFKIVVRNAIERRRLQKENASLRRELQSRRGLDGVIGTSSAIRAVLDMVRRVADTSATILLTGPRGTGKEVLARAVHDSSPRREKRFLTVNCAAIQESLLESELFGHVRGAFTGASSAHSGLFETAVGGTILLDEIGEMSASMQVKLLRVLQEKAIRRVGGTDEIPVDVRIVASTNRDLAVSVEDGTFRADLFDRLNVIRIEVPTLSARKEDIPLLVEHFLKAAASEMGRTVSAIEPDAMLALETSEWPGTVRELQHVIRRGVALASGDLLTLQSLPDNVLGQTRASGRPLLDGSVGFQLDRHLDEQRRQYIAEALERSNGRMVDAAKLLGMTFRALRYYAKKFDLR